MVAQRRANRRLSQRVCFIVREALRLTLDLFACWVVMFRFSAARVAHLALCFALASCTSLERANRATPESGVVSATAAFPAIEPSVTAAQIAASTWKKTSAPAFRGKQDDVYFIDAEAGWYVNGEGKLYGTKDGGSTWNLLHEKKGTFFRTVAFLDEKHGFIGNVGTDYFPGVTDETALYETRDGGVTLTEVKLPAKVKGLCAIDIVRTKFINQGVLAERTVIHAAGRVGGPPHFLRSLDGGATWKFIDLSAHAGPILQRNGGIRVRGHDRRHRKIERAHSQNERRRRDLESGVSQQPSLRNYVEGIVSLARHRLRDDPKLRSRQNEIAALCREDGRQRQHLERSSARRRPCGARIRRCVRYAANRLVGSASSMGRIKPSMAAQLGAK
jgi:hypothetical protein